MRIIHVEDRFEPQAGYQINEMIKFHVQNNNEVIVITSNEPIFSNKSELEKGDELLLNKYNINVIRLSHRFIISSRFLFKNLFKTIDSLKPDVVFMHGIGDFKDLILFKPKRNYIIVRDCHMSWVASKNKFNKIYYKIFKHTIAKYINKSNKYSCIYSLGCEETEYIKTLGISDKKIKLLLHGYNENEMFFSKKYREIIRNEMGYNGKDICIAYVGKFDNNKEPHYIFSILNNLDESYFNNNNIKILFIGPKDKNYFDKFLIELENFKYKKSCTILDRKKHNELYKYYSAVDIVIWPKECTLSSIHAQVCKCSIIMEYHLSNKERVYKNENLYKKNDLNYASKILRRIIDNGEFIKENNEDVANFMKQREYANQIKKIENSWCK